MTKFITVSDNIITGIYGGDSNVIIPDERNAHERIELPANVNVKSGDKLNFYGTDWNRKPEIQLMTEGLIPCPIGQKIENGKLVAMTDEEKISAGLITQEEINQRKAEANIAELNRRLAELQTPEVLAQAELNEDFAAERKNKLRSLLAVRDQEGFPLVVEWGC